MELEPRLLRYFLAVAGELNFGRAAKRVHIEQPALSVAIKGLEEDLGVRLLERDKRHVALTEAGKVFAKEARAIIAQSQRAIALVRGVAYKSSSIFQVGYCPFIDLELFIPIRSEFHLLEADQRVEFRSVLTKDQILPLLEGKLDAGLLILPMMEPELQFEVLI